jgi:hypothetical protein
MSAEGKPVLTDAPWSIDHGGENTRRFPLRSIVDGVSREAWKRETLLHLPKGLQRFSFELQQHSDHTSHQALTRRNSDLT